MQQLMLPLLLAMDATKKSLLSFVHASPLVTDLLSNLVARGLRADASMLFVIDGGKAIRKAL